MGEACAVAVMAVGGIVAFMASEVARELERRRDDVLVQESVE